MTDDQGPGIEAVLRNRQSNRAKERSKPHGLHKAEVQMRTGKIGLRAFLFERQVPDVMTPVCACGPGNSAACGSIFPVGGDNQTGVAVGVAVRDAHAPRFRHGYQGGQPDSVAHAEAASRRIQWSSRSQIAKSQ